MSNNKYSYKNWTFYIISARSVESSHESLSPVCLDMRKIDPSIDRMFSFVFVKLGLCYDSAEMQ